MSFVGPAALCRMDEALVSRVARGQGLGKLALSALASLAFGAAAYGLAFGSWRGPEQALYASLKLPLLFAGVVASTTVLNAMLALLLRARLSLAQIGVCLLAGMATTAVILAAMAPVSALLSLAAPPPDPSVLGLPLEDPRAAAANRSAPSLVLYHVGVIAVAGVLGNLRLFALLRRLTGRRETAIALLFTWLAVDLLAGSELSWILRPYLGRPHRPPELFIADAFQGSFFEEIGAAAAHALGPMGIAFALLVVLALAIMVALLLRTDGLRVEVDPQAAGMQVEGGETRFFVPWRDVLAAHSRESTVLFADAFEVVIDLDRGTGSEHPARRLVARFETREEAEALRASIAVRLTTRGAGPFRSSAAGAPLGGEAREA
ncbi:MAG: hypothetical protein IT378_24180 [Sandaracinaceae bacterium]|nr:hypothetical protein [Sandaracinaceae bacterium]